MTIQVNIHEAKTNLSKLLKAVEQGERVVIAKNGKPIAQVVALQPEIDEQNEPFLGWMRGRGTVPDDFDHFMQDEIIDMFEGSDSKS